MSAQDVAEGGCAKSRIMSLEECVDSAFSRNPAVNAAALEVEKSRILKGTAFNPPMTEVTLKQETTGGGGPENGVFFSQEFDFPTSYVARHRLLSAQNELQESRFNIIAADIEREVEALYFEMIYQGELLRLNAELGDIYNEFCRVSAVRLEQGDAGQLEVMNAQRVREKNEMERRSLLIRYEANKLELGRLAGCEGGVEPTPTDLTPLSETLKFYEPFDYDRTVMGKESLMQVRAADREVTLAKNEFLPAIRLGATTQALIKGFNPYNIDRQRFMPGNFMGFEVGITVPLFFGAASAKLKAANTERKISLLNRETSESAAKMNDARLNAELEALSSRLEYYREKALPRANEIKRIAAVSYELGDIDYLEYIASLETAYELYNEYATCINEINQNVIKLKFLRR